LFGGSSEDEDADVVTQKPAPRVAVAKAPARNTDDSENAGPETMVVQAAPQPKLPQFAAMPPLSSFRMAVLAPNAPMPLARPGAPTSSVIALQSATPQLVWQTGPQPLGGPAIPLPPMRNQPAPILLASNAGTPVPLPPVRPLNGKTTGHIAQLLAPDGAETTASLSAPAPLPKIIADGRSPAAPNLALAYANTDNAEKPIEPTAKSAPAAKLALRKPLSASAIDATHIALSGLTTRFSSADDLSPPLGQFSTKTAPTCSAGKSGQPCMPSAAR
jgi:hypothetical protein